MLFADVRGSTALAERMRPTEFSRLMNRFFERANRVVIACIAGKTGVKKVINETAMNADVTSTFVKQTGVAVEGANGYSAKDYNVWVFEPAVPYENAAVLKVTLG